MNLTIERSRLVRLLARLIPAMVLAGLSGCSYAAIDPDPSRVSPPAGDGWQILSSAPAAPSVPSVLSR